jgi:hypothetical protein
MAGFPGENAADIDGIWELSRAVALARGRWAGRRRT